MSVIEDITKQLDGKGIRSYADSSENHTPGWKFNQWEMKGVPIRIEIGPKDLENNSFSNLNPYGLEFNKENKKTASIVSSDDGGGYINLYDKYGNAGWSASGNKD